MSIETQVAGYLASLAEPARADMMALHCRILNLSPSPRLWFLDGKDSQGKVVSNPNIGYGLQNMQYASGKTREFYRVGISANTAGISVYIMGLGDKTYLKRTYAASIGKAKVTGYCISFKKLSDLNLEVLDEAVRSAFETQNAKPASAGS